MTSGAPGTRFTAGTGADRFRAGGNAVIAAKRFSGGVQSGEKGVFIPSGGGGAPGGDGGYLR